MLSTIRPRTLARKLGLVSLSSSASRRTIVLVPSLFLGRSSKGGLSSPSVRSGPVVKLSPHRRHNSYNGPWKIPTPSPIDLASPPPFVKPPPFDPSIHKGPPPVNKFASLPPRPPPRNPLPYERDLPKPTYYQPPWNTNMRQHFAIRDNMIRKEKLARGEDVRTSAQKSAAATAYSENLTKFLKESHDAFNSNDTVAESLVHLGLSSLNDRIPTLEVKLMPHQVLGVSWMVKQEAKEDYKGGILADDMGLGKTIQMLALMVINKSKDPAKRMTLIVVPNALLEQWKSEIETKSARGTFNVLIYHGARRTQSLEELQRYDVVITTYGTIRVDLADSESPIARNHWHRTVLDEAHMIRTKDSGLSTVIHTVNSDYRWTLTGTPIMNSFKDLYSQFRFLRVPTFSDWTEFSKLIANPNLDRETSGTRIQAVMKTIMFRRTKQSRLDGKLIVDLVPKTEHTEKLEFSESEREIYAALQENAQIAYNEYLKPNTQLKGAPQEIIVQLLRLRQATCHPDLVSSAEEFDEEEEYQLRLDKEMSHARDCHGDDWVKQTGEELETRDFGADGQACAVCSNPVSDPIVTSCCRELICSSCIDDLPTRELEEETEDEESEPDAQAFCPSCDADLGVDDLFKAAAFCDNVPSPILSDTPKDAPRGEIKPSTKMLRMNELVNEWLREDPDAKIIIFSQWTGHINLIAQYLKQEGHSSISFTGGMPQAKRAAALSTFEFEAEPKILLMNVKAGGVGLNIVRANKIIFMDLSWSPFVEAQAMARAHRIGQAKPVDVRRLVIANSVEDVMLAIQRRKMNESDISLGEGGRLMKPASRQDLADLFGMRNFNFDGKNNDEEVFNLDTGRST